MLKSFTRLTVFAAVTLSCSPRRVSRALDDGIPGWFLSGAGASAFRLGIDREVALVGVASGRLEAIGRPAGVATMMQSISVAPYLGRRVRLSAAVRTRDVDGWVGLWMRVERPDGRASFDNMQTRPLRGTNDWRRVEIVLDVADDARAIAFGLLQDGQGVSWIDDVALDPVTEEVAVTALEPRPRSLLDHDFESFDAFATAGKGWSIRGVGRDDFGAARDTRERHGGVASGRLENTTASPRGRAMLAQDILAQDYLSTRVRVSAWVKARGVERGAEFFVSTFAAGSGPYHPGLTRAHCPLREGDFQLCEGVLDVPETADTIRIGIDLQGKGTAWIDDVAITAVGLDVAPTEVDTRGFALANGDFEKSASTPRAEAPASWILAGGARAHYEAYVDANEKHGGKRSARLEPRVAEPRGYGTLMQGFRAHELRGKRMRMNAFVKGEGIDGRGDMWLRVQAAESPGDGPGLADGTCALTGTFDWKPCALVFDVPSRADEIQIGVGLGAHGKLWVDDIALEEVGPGVPVTEPPRRTTIADGFEDAGDAPRGWFVAGRARSDFTSVIDRVTYREGTASVRLEPRTAALRPRGYGTVMTSVLAEPYRGKRLRMNAQVRGRGIAARGDMWLRVQALTSPGDGPGLGGGSCVLSGDFEWKPCEIVFDVPERGFWIQAGIGLAGPGTIWLDEVKLEEVDTTVKPSGIVRDKLAPENLGFEL